MKRKPSSEGWIQPLFKKSKSNNIEQCPCYTNSWENLSPKELEERLYWREKWFQQKQYVENFLKTKPTFNRSGIAHGGGPNITLGQWRIIYLQEMNKLDDYYLKSKICPSCIHYIPYFYQCSF